MTLPSSSSSSSISFIDDVLTTAADAAFSTHIHHGGGGGGINQQLSSSLAVFDAAAAADDDFDDEDLILGNYSLFADQLLASMFNITNESLSSSAWPSSTDENDRLMSRPTGGGGGSQSRFYRHRLFLLDNLPTTVAINGWAHPPVAGLTLLTNCIVCVVLLRPEMRTPTNVLLVAMALCDMLTAVLPTTCFFRFYTLGWYADWVPFNWCYAYLLTTDYLPTVTHTASIWLTVALAAQRYLCVCRAGLPIGTLGSVGSGGTGGIGGRVRQRFGSVSLSAARWFATVRTTVGLVVVVCIVSFLAHCFRLGEYEYRPVRVRSLIKSGTTTQDDYGGDGIDDVTSGRRPRPDVVIGCQYDLASWLADRADVYFAIYYWSRVIVIHIVPSVALVVLNAGLVWTMRVAARRRRQLMQRGSVVVTVSAAAAAATAVGLVDGTGKPTAVDGGVDQPGDRRRRRECRRISESNATTMMLVAVVGMLLAVELPLAVLLVVMIVENTFRLEIVTQQTTILASIVVNFVILLSYPLNFFVYCAMSRKFRETFLRLFGCSRRRRGRQRGGGGRTTGALGAATSRRESTEAETRAPVVVAPVAAAVAGSTTVFGRHRHRSARCFVVDSDERQRSSTGAVAAAAILSSGDGELVELMTGDDFVVQPSDDGRRNTYLAPATCGVPGTAVAADGVVIVRA